LKRWRFAGDAEHERDELGECTVCGAPTPGDVCAFCRLRAKTGAIELPMPVVGPVPN
jgi:hypothetical protein